MKTKILLTLAGTVLATGFVLSLAGCGGNDHHHHHVADTHEQQQVENAVEGQQFCPVMSETEVDGDLYAVHDGKRVQLCCPPCVDAFENDPERYVEKLHEIDEDTDAHDEHDHGHVHEHDQCH